MKFEKYYEDIKLLDSSLEYFKSKNQLIEKDTKLLIQAHIDKAKHNLEFFNKNKEDSKFNDWLIVTLYYSLYHCALALVVNKNYISKNHTATLLFLIKHYGLPKDDIEFIDELSVNKEDAEFYTTLKEDRHSASYSTSHYFDDEKIENYKFKINEFLQKVIGIINK